MNRRELTFAKLAGAKAPGVLVARAMVIILFCYLCTLLVHGNWQAHLSFLHTTLEGACVAIAVFTFLTMWQNYERVTNLNRIVGFGFLLVGMLDFLHAYYFNSLNNYPAGYYDLNTRYWMFGRLSEALILLLGTIDVFNGTKRKGTGLLITLAVGIALAYAVYARQDWFPVLLTEQGGLTISKVILEWLVISLFLLNLAFLWPKIKIEENTSEKYLFTALIIAILAEICFTSYRSITAFSNSFGHLLKISYFYLLYRGLYATSVIYPYTYFETILNELPIGILSLDKSQRIVFVNNEAASLIGVPNSALLGLKETELARHYEHGEQSILKDVSNTVSRFNNVVRTIRINSHEANLLINGFQFSKGGWLVYFNDAKVAQQLENLELQTKTILNSLDSLVLVADANEKILMCNNSFIRQAGYSEPEVVNKTIQEVYGLLGFQGNKSDNVKGAHEGLEGSYVTKDGTKREVVLNLNAVYGVNEQIIGTIIAAADITSTKHETDRLRQQEKLAVLGQMAAGLVHEIRNPLTTIKGFSQLICTKVTDQQAKFYAETIVETCNELNGVVTDFLDFAKPRPPQLRPHLLSNVLISLKSVLESELMAKDIPFTVHLPVPDKEVLMDDAQIKQVLLNMAKNAIDAVAESKNPRIIIDAYYDLQHNEMSIQIGDNGMGISNDVKAKLGTPFFTTKNTGNGLGLSTCYQIIKEHDGRIELTSDLGSGTVFSIFLPCLEPDAVKQEQAKHISVA